MARHVATARCDVRRTFPEVTLANPQIHSRWPRLFQNSPDSNDRAVTHMKNLFALWHLSVSCPRGLWPNLHKTAMFAKRNQKGSLCPFASKATATTAVLLLCLRATCSLHCSHAIKVHRAINTVDFLSDQPCVTRGLLAKQRKRTAVRFATPSTAIDPRKCIGCFLHFIPQSLWWKIRLWLQPRPINSWAIPDTGALFVPLRATVTTAVLLLCLRATCTLHCSHAIKVHRAINTMDFLSDQPCVTRGLLAKQRKRTAVRFATPSRARSSKVYRLLPAFHSSKPSVKNKALALTKTNQFLSHSWHRCIICAPSSDSHYTAVLLLCLRATCTLHCSHAIKVHRAINTVDFLSDQPCVTCGLLAKQRKRTAVRFATPSRARSSKVYRLLPAFHSSKPLVKNKALALTKANQFLSHPDTGTFHKGCAMSRWNKDALAFVLNRLSRVGCMLHIRADARLLKCFQPLPRQKKRNGSTCRYGRVWCENFPRRGPGKPTDPLSLACAAESLAKKDTPWGTQSVLKLQRGRMWTFWLDPKCPKTECRRRF